MGFSPARIVVSVNVVSNRKPVISLALDIMSGLSEAMEAMEAGLSEMDVTRDTRNSLRLVVHD